MNCKQCKKRLKYNEDNKLELCQRCLWQILLEGSMKDLMIGDTIEIVSCEKWRDKIFIKYGKDDSVICVAGGYEDEYNDGDEFDTSMWEKDNWRIKKEPKYIPFTFEDAEFLIGKTVKANASNNMELVTGIDDHNLYFGDDEHEFKRFFETYHFLDGAPCGKLESKSDKD